jgi:hypothetical protein
VKIEIRSKEEVLVYKNQAERVSVRMLRSARPDEVSRVAQLLGGDEEMAALFILRDEGDVEATVSKLEDALGKIATELFADAKKQTPIDTGTLRTAGAYSAGKLRGDAMKKAKR